MPETMQSLGVILLGVIPGAIYVWAIERFTTAWGIKLSDRILRFTAASAIFLVIYAVPIRYLWLNYLHKAVIVGEKVHYENPFLNGGALPRWWWALPLALVATPFLLGSIVGWITVNREKYPRMAALVSGRGAAPTAWDHLFSSRRAAYIRLRLKDGEGERWVAGVFGAKSYASGYGEEPQDLYLEDTLQLDDKNWFRADDKGNIIRTGLGMLVTRDVIVEMDVYLKEARK